MHRFLAVTTVHSSRSISRRGSYKANDNRRVRDIEHEIKKKKKKTTTRTTHRKSCRATGMQDGKGTPTIARSRERASEREETGRSARGIFAHHLVRERPRCDGDGDGAMKRYSGTVDGRRAGSRTISRHRRGRPARSRP